MTTVLDTALAPAPAVYRTGIYLDAIEPVHAARAFVALLANTEKLPRGVALTVELVVDELVGNTDKHIARDAWPAGRRITPLSVTVGADRIVIEVHDPDPTLPTWPRPTDWDVAALDRFDENDHAVEGLRGLAIVAGLCDELTVTAIPGGKFVRAVLHIPGGAR